MEKLYLRLGLGEERKEERKGDKSRIHQERLALWVEFIEDDPYHGTWESHNIGIAHMPNILFQIEFIMIALNIYDLDAYFLISYANLELPELWSFWVHYITLWGHPGFGS